MAGKVIKITIELDRKSGLFLGIGSFVVGCAVLLMSLLSAVMMNLIISLTLLLAAAALILGGLFAIAKSLE